MGDLEDFGYRPSESLLLGHHKHIPLLRITWSARRWVLVTCWTWHSSTRALPLPPDLLAKTTIYCMERNLQLISDQSFPIKRIPRA